MFFKCLHVGYNIILIIMVRRSRESNVLMKEPLIPINV